jgi:opacity protein-like surface antigen
MKRVVLLLLAVVCVSVTAFAEAPEFKLSAGGGALFGSSFSYWGVDDESLGDLNRYDTTFTGGGFYGFFDATYAKLNVELLYGKIGLDNPSALSPDDPASTYSLRFGLYGKYPFAVHKMITIFPMVGAEYELALSAGKTEGKRTMHFRDITFPVSDDKQDAKATEALSTAWFKAGVGVDQHITDHLFMRLELLYGIRLNNKSEQYLLDNRPDASFVIGHGGDFKLALGYQF